jgi:hypothetical protein
VCALSFILTTQNLTGKVFELRVELDLSAPGRLNDFLDRVDHQFGPRVIGVNSIRIVTANFFARPRQIIHYREETGMNNQTHHTSMHHLAFLIIRVIVFDGWPFPKAGISEVNPTTRALMLPSLATA